jgi:hypothetical protein
MGQIFGIIDFLSPVIGLEGAFVLKAVVLVFGTYYLYAIPTVVLVPWIAGELTRRS